MTTKYNMIDQYSFWNMVPDANSSNLVGRVVAAIYQEIRLAEYANLSIAANGNLLVDNYKESIAVYLILASDHKMKVVVKSHDRNTLGRVQRTFESANSITPLRTFVVSSGRLWSVMRTSAVCWCLPPDRFVIICCKQQF